MKRNGLRVLHGNSQLNFSIGAVVESLQGAGVPTEDAIAIARSVERHYRHREHEGVALAELLDHLAHLLEKEIGPETARRFRMQTPPFVPIMVAGKGEELPFSKRTLATSLEKLELGFKEAYAVARQVEQRLRFEGYETVSERDLVHQTALSIEALLGRDMRLKYEAATKQPTDILVLEPGGLRFPFSRGILSQSLMAVGLGPQLSHQLAKRTEDMLWRLGWHEVEREQLRRVVRRLLIQEAGMDFARRYELMRSVRRPKRPIVILIGGVSGVGKSTLAAGLAYRLGIPRIVSSDSVREALRSLISEELSPTLHSSSFSAWRAELLPGENAVVKPTSRRVVRGFQMQVRQLNTALSAIVNRNIEEQTSLVMEGIHIVPGFMTAAQLSEATVVKFVLALADAETHRNRFYTRDVETLQRRPLDKYLEHLEEIRVLQEFILKRAKEEGVAVIDGGDLDKAVEHAIEVVLEAVLRELPETDAEAFEDAFSPKGYAP